MKLKNPFIKIVSTILFMLSLHANAGLINDTQLGVDGYFGYGINSNLRNISASGTEVVLGNDIRTSQIDIGFEFSIFGEAFTSLQIHSNGMVLFDSFNTRINGYSDVLNGNARYSLSGDIGERVFIIGFYDVPRFVSRPSVTFEVILHETTNNIELQYGALNPNGGTAQVGLIGGKDPRTYAFQGLHTDANDFSNQGYLYSSVLVSEPSVLVIFSVLIIALALRKRR